MGERPPPPRGRTCRCECKGAATGEARELHKQDPPFLQHSLPSERPSRSPAGQTADPRERGEPLPKPSEGVWYLAPGGYSDAHSHACTCQAPPRASGPASRGQCQLRAPPRAAKATARLAPRCSLSFATEGGVRFHMSSHRLDVPADFCRAWGRECGNEGRSSAGRRPVH